MTIGQKLAGGFAVTMVLQILIGAVCLFSTMRLLAANDLVNHTLIILENLQSLHTNMKTAESCARGFVISGSDDFLKPYDGAVRRAREIHAEMQKSLVGTPQRTLFAKLEEPMTGELAFLQSIIDLRKDPVNGAQLATDKVNTRAGLKYVQRLTEILDEMERNEKELLDARSAAAVNSSLAAMLAIGVATGLSLVLAVTGGWIVTRSITTRVRHLQDGANKLAQGNLSHRVNLDGKDEIGELGKAFDNMAQKRQEAHDAMKEAAQQIASASAEILAGTAQQAAGAQEQAAAVTQTMTTVDEVAQTSEQSAQRARIVGEAVQRTLEIGKTGRKVVDDSLVAMETVKERVESTAENILMLAEQAQAISEIIATVNDIAEQTNLLALNAAIEASRAGEHGKGFTVVAGEVKALADQSKKATAQVRQILGEIQKATNTAVLSTEEVTKGVASAIKVGGQAGETIKTLADTLAETSQAVKQIAASVGQQATGMAQINQAMKNIDQVAKQNTVATRQATQAAENLNALGTRLTGLTS